MIFFRLYNIWEEWLLMGEREFNFMPPSCPYTFIDVHRTQKQLPPPPPPLLSPSPHSFSSHWMLPHWSPLRPWLPAGLPLTFDLWPPAAQNSSEGCQLHAHSREPTVMTMERIHRWTMSTGVREDLYTPLLFITQCILTITEIISVSVHSDFVSVCVCFACHGPICPDASGLKGESCCSLMESCPRQRDPVTRVLRFHPY